MNKFFLALSFLLILGSPAFGQNAEKKRDVGNYFWPTAATQPPNPESSPSTPSQNSCGSLIPGTPLGLSCLHCAHPKAYNQAIATAEILRDSCRENVALTMLVDGTFGTDPSLMGELVRIASENGARVHLYLYFGNGPWQRRSGMPKKGFGTGIPPEEFRTAILHDPKLRAEFTNLLKFNEPLINYTNSLDGVIYIIPMLEDNLDAKAAREMEGLVRETLSPQLNYAVGRNPCPSCYPGNDTSVPSGIFMDQHVRSSVNQAYRDGLATNDGKDMGFNYNQDSKEISLTELSSLISEAKASNNTFVIWNREYQGVTPNMGLINPDQRDYADISPEERSVLIDILRNP